MTADPSAYRMRGHYVREFSADQIQAIAAKVCKVVMITRRSFSAGRIEKLVAHLEEYGINVDPINDESWIDATRANVDPQTGMIYMPEKLYGELCIGKPEAVRIFLHELGHIFLCHKPMLHFSDTAPKEANDSEWQADYFADSIIELLGLKRISPQLEFKF